MDESLKKHTAPYFQIQAFKKLVRRMRAAAAKKRGEAAVNSKPSYRVKQNCVLIVKVRMKSSKRIKPKEFSLQKLYGRL